MLDIERIEQRAKGVGNKVACELAEHDCDTETINNAVAEVAVAVTLVEMAKDLDEFREWIQQQIDGITRSSQTEISLGALNAFENVKRKVPTVL